MEKDGARALRRHHRERMVRKAYRQAVWRYSGICEEKLRWARLNHDHLALCSCFMCGNPHRYGKGRERWTLHERRGFISDREGEAYLNR